MATAKKLPSVSLRLFILPSQGANIWWKNKKVENKWIYESLTDDPGPAGRKRAKLTAETCRYANSLSKKGKPVPAKSVCNECDMIHSVLHKYSVNAIDFEQIEFSTITPKLSVLLPAKTVLSIIKGIDIEFGKLYYNPWGDRVL